MSALSITTKLKDLRQIALVLHPISVSASWAHYKHKCHHSWAHYNERIVNVARMHYTCTILRLHCDPSVPRCIHFVPRCGHTVSNVHTELAVYCNNTIARDTINTLNRLGTSHSVTIHWVPGHTNIPGNETADELARRGSATMPVGPEPFLPFSKNHSNTEIRNFTHRHHLIQYNNKDISEKGKVPILAYLKKHSYSFRNLRVTQLKWLTWMLSGHSPLFYFQHKIGKAYSPMCDYCQVGAK